MSTEGNCTRKNFLLADSRTKVVIYGLFTTRVYVHAFPSLCERTHTFKARGDGPLKGVDTGNAARCIPTQSGPKHGFSRIHCLSLYERILAGRGLIRKRKVQCSALWSWFDELVLISNNMSVQSRAKFDKIHPHESNYF